ncbi:MAG TPA: alpha/beta hydrolase [Acidimicrobiales bacterium]|nr:alpha/beta hydrolase [Acidimicrobiales bacterium]
MAADRDAAGPTAVRSRRVHTNGIELAVLEAGDAANPTVVLSHGFPETAYSWRHQLPVLAAAGYHVLAPDQRGYGDSAVPGAVEDYRIEELVADLVGLLDEAGKDEAVFVGHDWGSFIVWDTARLRPERVRAVASLSVPAVQWGPVPPVAAIRAAYGAAFHYVLYFEAVGVAEAELEADPYATIRRLFFGVSAEGGVAPVASDTPQAGFLDTLPEETPSLPWRWLEEADLRHYADQFARSGFFGPVSYYRNLDHNFEALRGIGFDRVTMPSTLIAGAGDPIVVHDGEGMFKGVGPRSRQLEQMGTLLPDYRGTVMIEGAGHWLQQEQPDRVNEALLAFLADL